MKGISAISAFVGASLLTSAAATAVPTQSPVNGHYYERFSPTNGINWTDARDAAAGMSFDGFTGHLATLTSAVEASFVYSTFPQGFTWIGYTDQVNEGQFRWITGETSTYTDWLTNEPNNSTDGDGEDFAMIDYRNGPQGGWNDYSNIPQIIAGPPISYLVEFDATPEPSSALIGLGMACGSLLIRRRARMPAA